MAKTETTVKGYVYTVTSPNGGTVTDAEGKLRKTVDAGDQVTVTAPSDTLTCDDDDAVICKANFKCPLLALRMLGQGANALPAGYTRLEYVDIVKLFQHDSVITTNALDVELDAQFVYNGQEYVYSTLLDSTSIDGVFGARRVLYFIPSYFTSGLRMVNDSGNRDYFPKEGETPTNKLIGAHDGKIPTYRTRKQVHIHDCGYDMDGEFYQFEPSAIVNDVNWGRMRFGSAPTASKGNHWRIFRCKVRQNGVMTADLIPCVRLADGCPGLWCNVYKKFYEQSPVATLALTMGEPEDNGLFYVTPEEELLTAE